jgi:hypothetical protein
VSVAVKKGAILAPLAPGGPLPSRMSLSLLLGGVVQNGPERSRARRYYLSPVPSRRRSGLRARRGNRPSRCEASQHSDAPGREGQNHRFRNCEDLLPDGHQDRLQHRTRRRDLLRSLAVCIDWRLAARDERALSQVFAVAYCCTIKRSGIFSFGNMGTAQCNYVECFRRTGLFQGPRRAHTE